MTTRTTTRRKNQRYPVVRRGQATVWIDRPAAQGGSRELSLIDLSASGVSFTIEAGAAVGLEPGTRLAGAAVRVGECEIRGELLVMHLTPQDASSLVCGALFYPRSDGDLIRLKGVVAGMLASNRD